MIAVLLATYNGEKYIGEQIESILRQTYEDFRVYVHDDGSNDNTIGIVNEYICKNPGKIELIDGQSTGGSTNNFLYLLKMVSAEYYMFSDQDDVWLPDKIEKSIKLLKKMEKTSSDEAMLVFSDMKVVDEDLRNISPSFIKYNKLNPRDLTLNRLIVQNVAAGCCMLFNRVTRDEALKYLRSPNKENVLYHDWWVILTAAGLGRVGYINEPLSLYRQHGDNEVGAVNEAGLTKALQLICWFISMSHIKETKNRIARFVKQGSVLTVLPLEGNNKRIVNGLRRYYKMNKIQRIRFFIKYDIKRNKRNLWQLICL